jgi:hypothetical protein
MCSPQGGMILVSLVEGAVEQPSLIRSAWQLSAKPARMAAMAIVTILVTILAECCGQGCPRATIVTPGGR